MSFEKLGLHPNVMKAIHELGFTQPTPIQVETIPILMQGVDLIGQAQTGTGKTAAFAISILQSLKPENKIQALVLVPTRELCAQVVAEFRELGKYMPHSVLAVYGGEDMDKQLRALHKGVQIVVATPGRLLDHLDRRSLSLANIHTCVLDEADRMLDMGFIDDVRKILSHMPKERQMVFFSATMPQAIIDLAKHNMNNPEVIKTSEDKLTVEKITQHYIMCDAYHKVPILLHLLRERKPKLAIVFVRTKRGADNLFYSLERNGLKAALLHGNLTQAKRDRSMHSFRNMHSNILVATDIAARGIDVDDVELVVNYNMPEDAFVYAHRIGRTARAGKSGEAITYITNMEEKRNISQFSHTLNCPINEMKIVGLNLPKLPEEKEEYRGHGNRPQRGYSRGDDDRGSTRGSYRPSGNRPGGSRSGGYGSGGNRGGSSGARPSYGARRPFNRR